MKVISIFDNEPPTRRAPSNPKSSLLKRLLYEIGALLLLLLFVPIFAHYYILLYIIEKEFGPILAIFGPTVVMPYLLMIVQQFKRIRRTGRRYSAFRYATVDAKQRLLNDRRQPIVFLR